MTLVPTVFDNIQHKQEHDPELIKIKMNITNGKCERFGLSEEDVLYFGDMLCIPNIEGFRETFK